jgi:hypothetical protein
MYRTYALAELTPYSKGEELTPRLLEDAPSLTSAKIRYSCERFSSGHHCPIHSDDFTRGLYWFEGAEASYCYFNMTLKQGGYTEIQEASISQYHLGEGRLAIVDTRGEWNNQELFPKSASLTSTLDSSWKS